MRIRDALIAGLVFAAAAPAGAALAQETVGTEVIFIGEDGRVRRLVAMNGVRLANERPPAPRTEIQMVLPVEVGGETIDLINSRARLDERAGALVNAVLGLSPDTVIRVRCSPGPKGGESECSYQDGSEGPSIALSLAQIEMLRDLEFLPRPQADEPGRIIEVSPLTNSVVRE